MYESKESKSASIAAKRNNRRAAGNHSQLVRQYYSVFVAAWRGRRQSGTPVRKSHEVQFLPAVLELQDTPVSPAPRIVLWVLICLVTISIVWACLGKVDVVAVGVGKVIASGRTKVIQPSETAVIKSVRVNEGDTVKAGDVLIILDPTTAKADVERLQNELVAARIDSERANAMLYAIDNRRPPFFRSQAFSDLTAVDLESAAQWLRGQYDEFASSVQLAEAEIGQRQADIATSQQQLASYRRALPIAVKLADDYQRLLQKQYIARHAYFEKEQARLEIERQITFQASSVAQAVAAKREAERRRDGVIAQARRTSLDLLHQADLKIAGLTQELSKAQFQSNRTILTSPVDGVVQQIATHTVGGVVTPAQQLMLVVPTDQIMEVEAILENKDVGFIHPGQPVSVKLDTFTFTKYGVLGGVVGSVSADAIEDEKRGLVYKARIQLTSASFMVNGKEVKVSPGMSVTAEVKTDERRIIEYFLSPLQQYKNESIRER